MAFYSGIYLIPGAPSRHHARAVLALKGAPNR